MLKKRTARFAQCLTAEVLKLLEKASAGVEIDNREWRPLGLPGATPLRGPSPWAITNHMYRVANNIIKYAPNETVERIARIINANRLSWPIRYIISKRRLAVIAECGCVWIIKREKREVTWLYFSQATLPCARHEYARKNMTLPESYVKGVGKKYAKKHWIGCYRLAGFGMNVGKLS